MAIIQTVTLNGSVEKIYGVLLSADKFAAATGAPADIASDAGGAFSCFGDMITGRHIELVPNQRIVQAWRVGMWPEGVYSIVRFDLSETKGSTTLRLEHTGYPEEGASHLDSGWHKKYWEPLQAYLGQNATT